MKRHYLVLLLILAAAAAFWIWRPSQADVPANVALESLLVDDRQTSDAFARATIPGDIKFPRDLGPHEDYETEWWYYTGNLQAQDGRDFGYQFTIFRRALSAPAELTAVQDPSDWRSDQIYLAHFTVSDIAADEFYAFERFSRDGADLAGASAEPYRVWLENWSVSETAPGQVRIQAAAEEVTLDLTLTQSLPPVLHGDGGLSQKGPQPGNASYYYSLVQQETAGQLNVRGVPYNVSGRSWKDHEYSTSALNEGAVGWDWFSLQLDNGAALMLFQIRRQDGSIEPYSSGTYVHSDGAVTSLSLDEWQLDVLDTWRSPTSGAEYPSRWQLSVPQLDLELAGSPLMADQELNVSTVYWEGAVEFLGTIAGEPVTADGYVEMTGYAPNAGLP
jgi:predicted secreted hydrolase